MKLTEEPAYRDFLATLGGAIVRWNNCQATCESITVHLATEPSEAGFLVAGMSAVNLNHKLSAMTDEFAPNEVKPHLEHYVKLFDCVRVYRNYYAHGIRGFDVHEGRVRGWLETIETNSVWQIKQELVFMQDIVNFEQYVHELDLLGGALIHYLQIHKLVRKKVPGPLQLPSLPEMRPLPPKLTKAPARGYAEFLQGASP